MLLKRPRCLFEEFRGAEHLAYAREGKFESFGWTWVAVFWSKIPPETSV